MAEDDRACAAKDRSRHSGLLLGAFLTLALASCSGSDTQLSPGTTSPGLTTTSSDGTPTDASSSTIVDPTAPSDTVFAPGPALVTTTGPNSDVATKVATALDAHPEYSGILVLYPTRLDDGDELMIEVRDVPNAVPGRFTETSYRHDGRWMTLHTYEGIQPEACPLSTSEIELVDVEVRGRNGCAVADPSDRPGTSERCVGWIESGYDVVACSEPTTSEDFIAALDALGAVA